MCFRPNHQDDQLVVIDGMDNSVSKKPFRASVAVSVVMLAPLGRTCFGTLNHAIAMSDVKAPPETRLPFARIVFRLGFLPIVLGYQRRWSRQRYWTAS